MEWFEYPRLRVATLNLAHGRQSSFNPTTLSVSAVKQNLKKIARTLDKYRIDVVAFQEADRDSRFTGGFCHTEFLSNSLALPYQFAGTHAEVKGPLKLDYGTAVLSRFPLIDQFNRGFNQSWRDTKGFVVSTLRWGQHDIDVVSLHLDFLNPLTRTKQAMILIDQLIERFQNHQRPLIVMGDFNCHRASVELVRAKLGLHTIGHSGQTSLHTYPAKRPRRRLDWILASEHLDFFDYTVCPDQVSDHRLVIADLRLGSASASPSPGSAISAKKDAA